MDIFFSYQKWWFISTQLFG